MTRFVYHPDILATYPTLAAGVMTCTDLTNAPSPHSLQTHYTNTQQAVLARIGDTPLSALPSLAAWRGVFRSFGTDPTQYRSAVEALLRRLTKKGDIPSINALVDIGNLISIQYAMPVAVMDTRDAVGDITVHVADGTERFSDLGQSETEQPKAGEVIFSDEEHIVYARRWCWRQGIQGTVNLNTRACLIVMEAHHEGAAADIQTAMTEMGALLQGYVGGTQAVEYWPR